LLDGETRVSRLGNGGPEDIEHTDVRLLAGDAPEPPKESSRFGAGELPHAADTEPIEITQQGGSDGNEILQPAMVLFHITSLTAPHPATSLI
jgi:hypothetical protein